MTGITSHPLAERNHEEGNMRKYLVAAILAAAVAVLASAAFGSHQVAGAAIVRRLGGDGDVRQDAHDRPRGADHRPRRRRSATSRFAGRSTTSSAGTRRRRTRTSRSRSSQGDTQLGVDTAFAVKVAQVVRVELEGARRRRARRQPGGRRVDVGLQGRRPRVRLGLRDSHVAHGRPHRRQPARVLLPHRAERRRAGPDGRQLDDQEAEVEAGLHHRRPGDLLAGPGRRRAEDPQRRGASRSPATRSARPTRTSRPRSRRSRATRRASTSRGSSPRRLRPSGSS